MKKVKIIAKDTNCSGGMCPTIYETPEGRIFVQGFNVGTEVKELIPTPKGEDLVEINQDLIDSLIKHLNK